jgi:hypothetical protein
MIFISDHWQEKDHNDCSFRLQASSYLITHSNPEMDAVLAWKSPSNGEAEIFFNARDGHTCTGDSLSNGVILSILHNSEEIFNRAVIEADAFGVVVQINRKVSANDTIYFVINSNGAIPLESTRLFL